MRLTTKGRFAVTAMIDLALHAGADPVTLAEISERQKISLSYLEQLFGKLRRRGLVRIEVQQTSLRAGVHVDLQRVVVGPGDVQPPWYPKAAARRIRPAALASRGRTDGLRPATSPTATATAAAAPGATPARYTRRR